MPIVEGPLAKHLREIAEGAREYPTAEARRHHFVPSFALSKFATPQKRRGVLYQLDTKTGRPRKTTPDDSCFVEELYTQEDEDGVKDRVLEGYFSIVENYASVALARFIDDPMKLTAEDRQTIAYYLAFQYQRTPVALDHSAATQQAMGAAIMGMQFAHPETFRTQHSQVFGDSNSTEEEIEQLRLAAVRMLKDGDVVIDRPELAAFDMMLRTTDRVASSFAGLSWVLLEAEQDEFITCDRAIAMHDPELRFPWSGHAPRSSPKAQTSCALTTKHMLVLVQLPQPVIVSSADAVEVREFNLRTYGWADQYVYGRTQEVVQRVRTQAKRFSKEVVRPKKPTTVLLEEVDPNDQTVGAEHLRIGWPRTVVIDDDDGIARTFSYQILDPEDPSTIAKAISAEEATIRGHSANQGERVFESVDPRDIRPV